MTWHFVGAFCAAWLIVSLVILACFITSATAKFAFCRYLHSRDPDTLRTKANSEATQVEDEGEYLLDV